MIKKVLKWLVGGCVGVVSVIPFLGVLSVTPVYGGDFLSDVAAPLLTEGGYGDERAYDFGLDDEADLLENLEALFFPDNIGDNQIWKFIRNIMIGVFVLFLIYSGAQFMFNADDATEINNQLLNLVYLIIGALIVFLSIWILDTLLDIRNIDGATGNNSLLSKVEQVILLVLGLLKGFAFFLAIILIVYNGIKMIFATGKEEKVKVGSQGVLNVVLALLFIKIIDYLYFIASQGDFGARASELIVQITRVLGYVLGIGLVLGAIYAGYVMITGQGQDDRLGKAKSMIKTIAVVAVVVLLFLLVIYQLFNDLL